MFIKTSSTIDDYLSLERLYHWRLTEFIETLLLVTSEVYRDLTRRNFFRVYKDCTSGDLFRLEKF